MIEEKDIHIRPATTEDAVPVCRLLKKLGLNLPDDDGEIMEHWTRIWDKNPYYNIFDEKVHYGTVMEYQNTVVGFFGDVPRVYLWNKEPIPVSIASQWGIDKDFRTFKDLLCDAYFNNHRDLKFVTTAIKPTGRIFNSYKGHEVPQPDLSEVIMVPLQLFNLLSLKFSQPFLKTTLKFFNSLIPWNFQYRWVRTDSRIKKYHNEDLGSELDRMFEAYHKRTKGLIAMRSVEILKWHNSKYSRKAAKEFFVFKEGESVKGYASICKEDLPEHPNMLRYKLIDLITLDEAIKKQLLKAVLKYCSAQKADVFEIHHPGLVTKKDVPSILSIKRRHKYFPLFFQTDSKEFEQDLLQPENWNISAFDGDTSL